MDPEIVDQITSLLGNNTYWILAAFFALLFKDLLMSLLEGIKVFFGNDLNEDDVIYLNGRKARVIRVKLTKTIFYMFNRHTKMMVPNERLKHITIEKTLPFNGENYPIQPKDFTEQEKNISVDEN